MKILRLIILIVIFVGIGITVRNFNKGVAMDDVKPLVAGVNTDIEIETSEIPSEQFDFSNLEDVLPDPKEIKTGANYADSRAEIIRQFLLRYESPLEPLSELIVSVSDRYEFDYRWLVAIAMQESQLCKRIPEDSYNCWGWGIYPDPSDPEKLKVTRFASFADAVRRIAPQFKKIFLKGEEHKDPLEVMRTYTPPSDGSWAKGVNKVFEKLY